MLNQVCRLSLGVCFPLNINKLWKSTYTEHKWPYATIDLNIIDRKFGRILGTIDTKIDSFVEIQILNFFDRTLWLNLILTLIWMSNYHVDFWTKFYFECDTKSDSKIDIHVTTQLSCQILYQILQQFCVKEVTALAQGKIA